MLLLVEHFQSLNYKNSKPLSEQNFSLTWRENKNKNSLLENAEKIQIECNVPNEILCSS